MIQFATEKDADTIANLWQEAFGDDREWVMTYLAENIERVLTYSENDDIFGMLSLLPVTYEDKKGYYVYGVATFEKHRLKGVSSKLLDFAQKMVHDSRADFLVLVPRNEGLFKFYQERGFFPMTSVKTTTFSKNDFQKVTSCEKPKTATAQEYYNIRKSHFDKLIEWDQNSLDKIKKFENGEFYKTENGNGAFCYLYNEKLYIKELCGDIDVAAAVAKLYDCQEIYVTQKCTDDTPSCMTFPAMPDGTFFNISID